MRDTITLKATSGSNTAIFAQTSSGSSAITALAGSSGNGVNATAGALISCSQVTGQVVAKSLGLEVDRFQFEISADLDTAILVAGATEGNANFETVTVKARLTTNASDSALRALQIETERRCPIYQFFARSGVAISTIWVRAEA